MSVRVPSKKDSNVAGRSAIKCSCGKLILMVPNVKVMSEAIEVHVAEHTKKVIDRKEAEAEAERVRDDLIVQILEKASQS